MKINTIVKKLRSYILFKKIKRTDKKESKLQIRDFDEDSEVVNIDKIGITEFGQGAVIFKTNEGKEFPISAFSPETAKIISDFREGKDNEVLTVYNMLEQICENSGLHPDPFTADLTASDFSGTTNPMEFQVLRRKGL